MALILCRWWGQDRVSEWVIGRNNADTCAFVAVLCSFYLPTDQMVLQSPSLRSPHTQTHTHATRWRLGSVFIPSITRVRAFAATLRSSCELSLTEWRVNIVKMWEHVVMFEWDPRRMVSAEQISVQACLWICQRWFGLASVLCLRHIWLQVLTFTRCPFLESVHAPSLCVCTCVVSPEILLFSPFLTW